MSFTHPKIKSFKAGSNLSTKQYTFVKFGSDDETVVPCSVADENSIGILMNAPDFSVGELCEVALPGGGAKLKSSGIITRGQYLSSDVNGAGKTPGAASHVGAIAHASAVAGDIFEVIVTGFYKA